MKVLQIVKTEVGANWAFEQTLALAEKGIEIITVLPSPNGRTAQKYLEHNLQVYFSDFSLPIKCPWKIFKKIKSIKEIVNKVKPDIIHSHFVTNIIMIRIALRKCPIPRLFQVPGPLHLESLVFRKLEILSAQKQDYWMGACKRTVELYKENGISENKLFLGYYGGYGGDTCEEYAKSNNIIHNEYNIPQENTTIGMVSYVYKPKSFALQRRGIKGHEDFIDALEIVRKKHPKITGVIIGDAWGNSQKYFDKIKIYAKENSKADIIFTDYRSDIKDIYCELDVVVHPSHSENLGGAAESLAAARPTISTNVGGFRDIVIDNKTGKLVPPKNPQKLAEAIIVVIENYENAQKMANEGQKLVRELLDIDKCTECIIDAYKNILGV